jgi:hypothetical protein
MSYIIKKNDPLVNVKLTNNGRRNLAEGTLNFTYFGLGDSEMDYTTDDVSNVNILRPSDNTLSINYPVSSDGVNEITPITLVNAIPNEVYTSAIERGFFDYTGTTTHPTVNLASLYNIIGTTIGTTNSLTFQFTTGSTKNVDYIDLKPGDYLFVKYENNDYVTGVTYSQSVEITEPVQYFWYSIETVTTADSGDNQTLTGITTGTTITVIVDRQLPIGTANLTGFVYPGKDTIKDYYDKPTPLAYWQGGLLDFSNNNTQSELDVPVWNMNIINIEDVIGLDPVDDKSKYDTVSSTYLGAAIRFNQYDVRSKIGVIHYTNNTVSNFYGEGFYRSTLKLKIPYIMWHKQQFTAAPTTLGYTFVADTELKTMTVNSEIGIGGLVAQYYDLVDQEVDKNVVGKVFIDEKIIVIEDPELLSVLSYKANRNWSLPKPILTLTEPGVCGNTSTIGSVQPGEYFFATYLFADTNGVTGMHCEDYTMIYNNTDKPKDVLFEFNKKTSDPNYSEFNFLKDYNDTSGTGFKTNQIYLLWQKSEALIKPDSTNWSYVEVSEYLGTNGCVTGVMKINGTEFELHADIYDYQTNLLTTHPTINLSTFDAFELGDTQVGEVIVIFNGTVQKGASDDTLSDGDYYLYPTSTGVVGPNNRSVIVFGQGYGVSGDLLQLYYLIGTSVTAKTIKQVVTVPSLATINSNTNADPIYKSTIAPNRISLKLNKQPNNSTVWLFYKGMLLSSATYGVFVTNETIDDRRVELNFTPAQGSEITIFYLDNSGAGQLVSTNVLTKDTIAALRVNIDQFILDNSETDIYLLTDYIDLPSVTESDKLTFGDEVFFYGNVETDIKATIFKTQITCNVLPNQFTASQNPTFNPDQDKVAFTEIAIYDSNNIIVATGKFSEPVTRKYNSDMLVLQATIDF